MSKLDPGKPQAAIIDQWAVIDGRLHGNVYGHPKFEEGAFVRCSRFDPARQQVIREGGMAYTANTIYSLGKPLGKL